MGEQGLAVALLRELLRAAPDAAVCAAPRHTRCASGLAAPVPRSTRKRWGAPDQAASTLLLTSMPGVRVEFAQLNPALDGGDVIRVLRRGCMVGFAMMQRRPGRREGA